MPDKVVYRKIINKSDKELRKLYNSETVVIPVSDKPVEVQQGLAFFLSGKFPGKIEILPVDDKAEREKKPEPLVKPVKEKITEEKKEVELEKTEETPKGKSK